MYSSMVIRNASRNLLPWIIELTIKSVIMVGIKKVFINLTHVKGMPLFYHSVHHVYISEK